MVIGHAGWETIPPCKKCKELQTENKRLKEDIENDWSRCRYCGADRIMRPTPAWQYVCHCDEPDRRPKAKINRLEAENKRLKRKVKRVCVGLAAMAIDLNDDGGWQF